MHLVCTLLIFFGLFGLFRNFLGIWGRGLGSCLKGMGFSKRLLGPACAEVIFLVPTVLAALPSFNFPEGDL